MSRAPCARCAPLHGCANHTAVLQRWQPMSSLAPSRSKCPKRHAASSRVVDVGNRRLAGAGGCCPCACTVHGVCRTAKRCLWCIAAGRCMGRPRAVHMSIGGAPDWRSSCQVCLHHGFHRASPASAQQDLRSRQTRMKLVTHKPRREGGPLFGWPPSECF